MSNYGKLVLIQAGNPEQEFELNKASVLLGRAMTNDIVLGDARVSRAHAQIVCKPEGCTLIDLGSSNGTRLNGNQIKEQLLEPGDTLTMGSSTLVFEAAGAIEEADLTIIDSFSELENTIAREIVPMALNETNQPRLVVFTKDSTWEIPLDMVDELTVGRSDDNQIIIPQTRISRHHARVTRIGSGFSLRDLDSTNGTWLRGRQIEEIILQDGDMIQIGDAQVVFKNGFSPVELTMVAEKLEGKPEKVPVVFVPGMMGSELWLGNERVWPSIKSFFSDADLFKYTADTKLEPRGIVDQVVIVPNLIKQDQYNRLGDYLVEDLGYIRGKDFFEFAYDWRQDVRQSARQLGEFIENLPFVKPVVVIGHSLGTMVSRYYIEKLGGDQRVQRVILMGGPHRGVPKALTSLLTGPNLLPFGMMGEKLRQVIMTFPSSYQILPVYPCAIDQNGTKHNFLEDDTWVPEEHRPLLHNAREFRKELGYTTSVPAVSIFGYGLKTISSLVLELQEHGLFSKISFNQEPAGDSTIPQNSAVLEGTEIHPVQQYHGSLFVDQDVKMRLKLELTRSF